MARDFNGSSDYIRCARFVTGDNPISLSCWVNIDSLAAERKIISTWDPGSGGIAFLLSVGTGGALTVASHRAGSFWVCSGGSVSTGAWVHLAGVVSNSAVTAYVNGSQVNSVGASNYPGSSSMNYTFVGSASTNTTPDSFLDGKLAEVAAWSAVLTTSEVTSLAKGFRPSRIRPQSLAVYMPLIDSIQDVRTGQSITSSGTSAYAHPRVY